MKKQIATGTAAIAIMVFSSFSVFGQQEKGDTQMQFSFSFRSNSTNGNTTSSLMWQYSLSKFFTKHTELGASYIAITQKDFSFSNIAPFLNFNMLSKNGKFVFYLGAQYLLSQSTFSGKSTTSGGVGGKIGIRSYLSDNVFLFFGPNFTALPNKQTQFDMTAGVGVLFKKIKKTQ